MIGVYLIGMTGNIGSTVIASSIAMKKGILKERWGMITKAKLFEKIGLVGENEFEFVGCDIRDTDPHDTSLNSNILPPLMVEDIFKGESHIKPRKAISYQDIANILGGANNIHKAENLATALEYIIADLENVKAKYEELIVVDIMSTETYVPLCQEHSAMQGFLRLIKDNRQDLITPSMLYAYASIKTGCPFIEFTPNLSLVPKAIQDYAIESKVPICGKDASTGQTLYKTVLADMFKKRNLNITGWYSTNILGNSDGKALTNEEHIKTKIDDKYQPLKSVLGYDPCHIVDIKYYPPRGDNKEAWDNVDFEGWFGLPMSMKIDWIGRDTILAVPALFDLLRLVEFAKRNGEYGLLEHLSIFFKNPVGFKENSFLENYIKLQDYARENSKD